MRAHRPSCCLRQGKVLDLIRRGRLDVGPLVACPLPIPLLLLIEERSAGAVASSRMVCERKSDRALDRQSDSVFAR